MAILSRILFPNFSSLLSESFVFLWGLFGPELFSAVLTRGESIDIVLNNRSGLIILIYLFSSIGWNCLIVDISLYLKSNRYCIQVCLK